ncbi:RNA methyltransferase [Desulfofustis glycolicus]|uniref:tRNA (cytidine/uridine-2'-O-)-methyltransferase TrmJ n=1 Tax=Desulfofustis glycolicus DSM 9705 TaxID=1121409 RepID=A0A1M5UGI2_9BACT|nr:RNA methyltransferase [Desulfofustis glycolicus]MCB2217516.1 RNA methyltransferase [Desulfobulbaceae bacterium]SHH61936.1 tRNA/rRNA methyltransferase [Desulfofustis glycolicus DSM 9705]
MYHSQTPLDQITVVLKNPKFPENIGATARSCFNMGISRLIVVGDVVPRYEDMAKMATHKAVHLIDTMEMHPRLEDALAPFHLVVGTTARLGRKRTIERSPRDIVAEILPLLSDNRTALLFGPEDRGLTNDDLKYCHYISCIPTADFASLNLAQAVAIHCYEIYNTLVEQTREPAASPATATVRQLEGMYQHIEDALLAIDFLDEKGNIYWMQSIRRLLGRIRLTAKEANIIRGICRKFLWHQVNRSDNLQKKPENP